MRCPCRCHAELARSWPLPGSSGSRSEDAPREQLVHRLLRAHRVDRQARPPAPARRSRGAAGGPPSASGRSRPRGRASGAVWRSRLYGGAVELRQAPEHVAQPSAAEARSASVARPKSASWRRGTIQTSNGERDANGANATEWSSSQRKRVPRSASTRTARQYGHSRSRMTKRAAPADLLGHLVRDLGQVVQVQAEVVRARARLAAPVLQDLEVLGLAGRGRPRRCAARAPRSRLRDQLRPHRVERPVLAGRRDDRPPAAGGAGLAQARSGWPSSPARARRPPSRRSGTRSP